MIYKNLFKKENRKIVIPLFICIILIGITVSYTYSFFAVETKDSSSITGEAESMNLQLTVTPLAGDNQKLIPQLDEYITSAIVGRKGSCIDDNGNTVCHTYEIILKNTGASSIEVTGTLALNPKKNPNLKWAVYNYIEDSETGNDVPSLVGDVKIPNETTLVENVTLISKETKTYYIVVWISETGVGQTDEKDYSGVVKFNTANSSTDTLVNAPKLTNGLIPVTYNGTTWITADSTNVDNNWYDYESQTWANAVLVNNTKRASLAKNGNGTYVAGQEIGDSVDDGVLAFYVWIPRFKYKVWNINRADNIDSYNAKTTGIDIVFENGTESTGTINCTYNFNNNPSAIFEYKDYLEPGEVYYEICSGSNGDYYTHPAFTFGEAITGFWVSKFEMSSNDDNVILLPNVTSTESTLSSLATSIQNMQISSNVYGLSTSTSVVDSHMAKNTEWGAIAYLTNSKYGRCSSGTCTEVGSSSENSYNTESGTNESTTGNVYGIYDMNGGVSEHVMANVSSSETGYEYNTNGDASFPSNEPATKYIDRYGKTFQGDTSYDRSILGDATTEWYGASGTASFPTESYPSFARGSNGIFEYSFWSDMGYGPFMNSRAILTVY